MEFLRIWEIISRRRWIIISVFLAFFLAVVAGTKLMPPLYKSRARVLLDSSSTASSVLQNLGMTGVSSSNKTSSSSSSSSDAYDTDIALTTLRPLLEDLISQLHLKRRNGDTCEYDTITENLLKKIILPEPHIAVDQYEEASMLKIDAYSTNPEEAAQMANLLAELTIKERLERQRKEYKAARLFLSNEIAKVRSEYYAYLDRLQNFKIKEKSVDLSYENQSLVNKIATLLSKLNDLQVSLAEKRIDYTQSHPEVQKIVKEAEAVKSLLDATTKEIDQYAAKYAQSTKLELPLSVNKDMFKTLLEYAAQVGMAESMTLSDVKLVEPAKPAKTDKPFTPNKPINYILGLFMAAFWSLFAAFFTEYIDNTIKSPADVKRFKFLNLLGTVPRLKTLKTKTLVTDIEPTASMVEAFRTIRYSIQYSGIDKPMKSFMVTSCIEGEGKSSMAANCAAIFSMEGKRVILVDLDLRRPTSHTFFALPNTDGVTKIITGGIRLEDAILKTRVAGLDLLPSGVIPVDPNKILESKKLGEIIRSLSAMYDIVVVDAPPVIPVNDAVILGNVVDGTIFVMESGKVTFTMLEHVREMTAKANLNIIGVVFNKLHVPRSSYYHYNYYKRK
jgi:tyrosine-protein kinase Etk/Wzc